MTRTTAVLMCLELTAFSVRYVPEDRPQTQHIDRERITVEEISQWRRTLRQRVKEMPEWDRNTFEETAP